MSVDVDLNLVEVPLVLDRLFGRQAPADVEVGCGKGRFLCELAEAEPGRNLLAVERAGKYHALCCERVLRRGLDNVRLLRTTAEDLVFRLLRPGSVERMFILFPDPWPKKRHHKRRFVTPANMAAVVEVLTPGGRVLIKSDHDAYAEVIGEVLAGLEGVRVLDPAAAFEGLPLTGFEAKYREQGRAIHPFAVEREA